ncbi:MAG: T9SS type A sorting domain-containing protein [Sphingobacteriaceae bacterium]|jgi:hypothetical protein
MKKLLLSITALVIGSFAYAQSPFWTENFGSNPVCGSTLAAAFTSTNGAWTVTTTGTNDLFSNEWFVSPREAGMGAGNCGSSCSITPILINNTMHVSTTFSLGGDVGAAYAAGPGLSNTNKRAQSPTINCAGQSTITLRFNYIMWGIINQDFAQVMYSADNGVTWSGLGTPAQTPTNTCAGQGLWTTYSVALPASANNNSTVKIGFRWQNISSTGADPSFAVDDITLTSASTSSVTLTPTFTLPASICAGNSTTVTANTGTTVASGYTWSAIPSISVSIASPNASVTQITFPNSGTYSVNLTVTSGTMIASTSQTILVNPKPNITIIPSSSFVCSGSSAVLTASGAISYTWLPGNSNGFTVAISPTVNTTYTAVGSNTFGCVNTKTYTAIVVPKPTITINSSTLTVCMGSAATLTASGAPSLTWQPGNVTSNTLLVTPTVNTTYTAVGTGSFGCTGSNTISISVITCSASGIADQSLADGLKIYPNPFTDKLYINVSTNIANGLIIQLNDVTGKLVYCTKMADTYSSNTKELDLSNLKAGVYILKVGENERQMNTYKLIKE